MERFVIDQKTNTLVKCNHSMMWERLDYLIIPHQYKGKQIDRIGPHCFDHLIINLLCIEEGVEYLEDEACENSHIYNVKLPRGLKIGKRCFAGSQLEDILLPKSLHIIKEGTFSNCKNLKSIWAQRGLNTISYDAFNGCKSLKEAHFHILKNVRDRAFTGCSSLETLDLGYQIKELGSHLFNGCSSLKSLEIQGDFDKLEKCTFSGADALESLSLWTHAESLYFPPDGFKNTPCLKEISLKGDFEPIVKKRSCFPEDILLKMYYGQKALEVLGYYFNVDIVA